MSVVTDLATLPPDTQTATIDMVYNLGLAGFKQFTALVKDLNTQDVVSAAIESMDSLRAVQLPKRASDDFALFVTAKEAMV